MKFDFHGQVALITGATRGIGRQIAEDFLSLGAKVIITGTTDKSADELIASLPEDQRRNVDYYSVDFLDVHSMENFFKAFNIYQEIHILVNNAGINRINFIDETRIEDWNDIIDVNLKAPFEIMRKISKIMKKNRYGRIVNISSIFGVISKEKRSIYSASKFGLRGLTVAISNELAQYNIMVNTVSPGFVLTDLTRSILSQKEMAELAEQVPAKRLADPKEVSRVILFMASRLNTYITGQNIIVDGGFINV